jgi:hypothetical protein
MPAIFGFAGAAAADASVLAHRLDDCLLRSFRLALMQADEEERRMHRENEAFLDEVRMPVLQQCATIEDGRERDILGSKATSC